MPSAARIKPVAPSVDMSSVLKRACAMMRRSPSSIVQMRNTGSVLSSSLTDDRIAVVIDATSSPRVTMFSDRPVQVQATSGICISGR